MIIADKQIAIVIFTHFMLSESWFLAYNEQMSEKQSPHNLWKLKS